MHNTYPNLYISTVTIITIYDNIHVCKRSYLAVIIRHTMRDNVKKDVILRDYRLSFVGGFRPVGIPGALLPEALSIRNFFRDCPWFPRGANLPADV